MPRVRSKASRQAAGLFVASAAVLVTAACGGGSDNSSTTTTGGGNAAFTAYVDCMKTNGVTITPPSGGPRTRPSDGASRGPGAFPPGMPRPSGSAGARGFPGGGGFGGRRPAGVDDATWQKAQTACASLRPGFGGGRNGGDGDNGMDAAYRNCLKEHGVTATGRPDATDPTVATAMKTCKVLQPSASPSA